MLSLLLATTAYTTHSDGALAMANEAMTNEARVYVDKSKIKGAGRGVFAARAFAPCELIESAAAIPCAIRENPFAHTTLTHAHTTLAYGTSSQKSRVRAGSPTPSTRSARCGNTSSRRRRRTTKRCSCCSTARSSTTAASTRAYAYPLTPTAPEHLSQRATLRRR